MKLIANLKEGWSSRIINIDVPVINHPLLPVPYVDSRWARPFVFRDVSRYPLSELESVKEDFNRYVSIVNNLSNSQKMERYKEGLLKIVDEHITRCGRVLFCDLLMYVDCLAYLCYASDLMTEEQIVSNYAHWAKYVVDRKSSFVLCSTKWGAVNFAGSENEQDLNSCL